MRASKRYKCSVDVRAQTALNHFDTTYVVRTPDHCAAAYIAQESRKGLSACISVARLDSFTMICSHVNTRTNVSVYHTYGLAHTQKFVSDLFRYENRRIYLRAHFFFRVVHCLVIVIYLRLFVPDIVNVVWDKSHITHMAYTPTDDAYMPMEPKHTAVDEKRKMKRKREKNNLSRYYKASICPVARMEFLRDLWRENSNSFGVYFSH